MVSIICGGGSGAFGPFIELSPAIYAHIAISLIKQYNPSGGNTAVAEGVVWKQGPESTNSAYNIVCNICRDWLDGKIVADQRINLRCAGLESVMGRKVGIRNYTHTRAAGVWVHSFPQSASWCFRLCT